MRVADLQDDGAGGIGEIDAHAPGRVTVGDCAPVLEQIRRTAPRRRLEQSDKGAERPRRFRMASCIGRQGGTTDDLHAAVLACSHTWEQVPFHGDNRAMQPAQVMRRRHEPALLCVVCRC